MKDAQHCQKVIPNEDKDINTTAQLFDWPKFTKLTASIANGP